MCFFFYICFMVKRTLAIMAAGMGSRFGSLKQLHPVYDTYAIMDYSIHDAIQVGYNHIVFIVRDEILESFKKRYIHSFPEDIYVEFLIQSNILPDSQTRKKPWGTGHALLALKETITNDFTLINADDFYGRHAFQLMYNAIFNETSSNHFLVGYALKNTLSENGSVSRGICRIDANDNLRGIEEQTAIGKNEVGAIIILNDENPKPLKPDTLVSMNFWGFKQYVFNVVEDLFSAFINDISDFEKDEFYITYIINHLVENSSTNIKVLATNDAWFGITYLADEFLARKQIKSFIEVNKYPKKLW